MKLHWKLSAGLGVVVLATTLAVGVVVSAVSETIVLTQTERALRHGALLLGELVRHPRAGDGLEPGLQAQVVRLGRALDTRFTVIAADGRVLADSDQDPATMESHAQRPEVLAAGREGHGSVTRWSHTLATRMLYVAVPLDPAAPAAGGYVRAAVALAQVDASLRQLRELVVIGAALGLFGALVPGVLLARRVTTPLVRMTATARALAQGDYRPRVPTGTRDELGSLAEAFNVMAAQLRERMETITTDRNKLRAILASMVEGVVAIDEERLVVHMNDVAAKLLGADEVRSIGRPIGEVTRVAEVSQALARVLEHPEPRTDEVQLPGAPRDLTIQLHAAPLRGPDEAVAGALVVLHDVSELRHLEAVRRDFVANVSHELKTPLTAIRGQVETLLDDPDMPFEQRQRFLSKARDQAERLSVLVRDLLVLSRIEASDSGLLLELHDLRLPVQASARSLQAAVEAKRLGLEVVLPAGPLVARADREHVRQVVDNLLTNAVSYTPEGGRVRLELRAQGEDAVIEVADTGIGIAPAHQERIFERFYRVDKARSRNVGGTGLGLAIVKHVAFAHGGGIELESAVGRGSTFRFRIPRREHEDPADA